MTVNYVATHPYERSEGDYCEAPDPTSSTTTCTRPAEHPVHATDRPEVEQLARQLAGHQWRTNPEELGPWTEHRRHNYNYDCAICTQDLHAIASAVLAIQEATR
jgi:hypothetical protein